MWKFFTLAIVLAASVSAQAVPSEGCLYKIAEIQHWGVLSDETMNCLYQDVNYQTAVDRLCDQEELSVFFKTYLSYWNQANAAALDWLQATDPTAQRAAHAKWSRLEYDWKVLGAQPEVDRNLIRLIFAKNRCVDQRTATRNALK